RSASGGQSALHTVLPHTRGDGPGNSIGAARGRAGVRGRRLPSPSSPGKAVTQNQFDEQAICLWRQANADPNIAFPLRPEVEIKDREQQVLLLAEWVKGRDRSDPPIVLQASTDLWQHGVAEFGIGGKCKAAVGAFAFQAPVEHRIERGVPGPPLLIKNRSDLDRPGIRGEGALLIANLRRQTQAHGHMPTLWDAHPWTDMIPHPLPARIRLDTGEDIEPGLEPRGEAVGDFKRLMHSV